MDFLHKSCTSRNLHRKRKDHMIIWRKYIMDLATACIYDTHNGVFITVVDKDEFIRTFLRVRRAVQPPLSRSCVDLDVP